MNHLIFAAVTRPRTTNFRLPAALFPSFSFSRLIFYFFCTNFPHPTLHQGVTTAKGGSPDLNRLKHRLKH